MNDRTAIIESFTSQEMKDEISKLLDIMQELANKTPVVGLHHRFYVPGWIGFVQQMIVEQQMDKVSKQSFSCAGLDYYEFGNWIINKSVEIVEMQGKYENTTPDMSETQNEIINRVFSDLVAIWASVIPEVASYCNIQYAENTLISRHAFILKTLDQTLEKVGRAKYPLDTSKEPSFKEQTKHTARLIAGYLVNILVLGVIFGILNLFGVIN